MGLLNRVKTDVKQLVRRIVPSQLLKDRYIYRRLGEKAGPIYMKLRALDAAGVHSQNERRVPASAKSIVFVCFGNIMRSAMAEHWMIRLMREEGRHDIEVSSAGMHATNGNSAHPWAQLAATGAGFSLESHKAQLLTQLMVDETDALLAMDFQNKAELLAQYPDAADRVFMLTAYADPPWKGREIPDPYFGDEEKTRACCGAIEICVRRLLASLQKPE
jgi:protein-tyrosine-phosphatase